MADSGVRERIIPYNPDIYIYIYGLGRKAFKMPVTKVCDALRLHNSVLGAANELGCSRAYVYKVLKTNGLTAKEVLEKS